MQTLPSRILALHLALALLSACGSENRPTGDGQSDGSEDVNPGGGSGSASSSRAQLRFLYTADWAGHLGPCAWISDYRIKFGAIPLPVTAPIEVTPDSLSEYFEVEGRLYADNDVLHIFTCSKSQTSKQTLQLTGRFGVDLPLEPAKHYTVTLGGGAATLAEDP